MTIVYILLTPAMYVRYIIYPEMTRYLCAFIKHIRFVTVFKYKMTVLYYNSYNSLCAAL